MASAEQSTVQNSIARAPIPGGGQSRNALSKLGTCLRQPTNSADFGIGVGGVRGLHSPAACSSQPGEGLIPAVRLRRMAAPAVAQRCARISRNLFWAGRLDVRESAEIVSVSGVERQSGQLLMPTVAARAANCSWIIAFQFQRRPVLPHNHGVNIAPAEGKLGVLIPGLGAVTTTFIAGIEAIRRGLGKPIGSVTQMGTVRLGKRTEGA